MEYSLTVTRNIYIQVIPGDTIYGYNTDPCFLQDRVLFLLALVKCTVAGHVYKTWVMGTAYHINQSIGIRVGTPIILLQLSTVFQGISSHLVHAD